MTKEEIWENLETEFKLRGYSKKSISTYKAGITTFLDWANKPYEDLDEEDFRNYLIHIIQEGKLKPQTINSKNSAIRFFLVVILGKNSPSTSSSAFSRYPVYSVLTCSGPMTAIWPTNWNTQADPLFPGLESQSVYQFRRYAPYQCAKRQKSRSAGKNFFVSRRERRTHI